MSDTGCWDRERGRQRKGPAWPGHVTPHGSGDFRLFCHEMASLYIVSPSFIDIAHP